MEPACGALPHAACSTGARMIFPLVAASRKNEALHYLADHRLTEDERANVKTGVGHPTDRVRTT
jgi:hypothetical protein